GAQPDWYMLFLEGSLRLMPGWEVVIGGFTLSLNILIPGVIIPGLMFTFLALYPFIDRKVTKDTGGHHLVDELRSAATRTSLGVACVSMYLVRIAAGSNDASATHFDISLNRITWIFWILFFVLPVVSFMVTKRSCIGLQRKDRELALHGHETGRIVRFASGEFIEVHKPLDEYERWVLVSPQRPQPPEIEPPEAANGADRPGHKKERRLQKLSQFFYEDRV